MKKFLLSVLAVGMLASCALQVEAGFWSELST